MADPTADRPPRGPTRAVYVISVAAELAGLHPQTLRIYERKGLRRPGPHGRGQPALQRCRHRAAAPHPGAHQRGPQPGRRAAGPRARSRAGGGATAPRQRAGGGAGGRGAHPPAVPSRSGAAPPVRRRVPRPLTAVAGWRYGSERSPDTSTGHGGCCATEPSRWARRPDRRARTLGLRRHRGGPLAPRTQGPLQGGAAHLAGAARRRQPDRGVQLGQRDEGSDGHDERVPGAREPEPADEGPREGPVQRPAARRPVKGHGGRLRPERTRGRATASTRRRRAWRPSRSTTPHWTGPTPRRPSTRR